MNRINNYSYGQDYSQLRNNLQRQTADLLAQRQQFQRYSNPYEARPIRPSFKTQAPISPIVDRSQDQSRTHEVVNRLQEIIRLCKDQTNLSQDQMNEVLKVQAEVLGYLQRTAPAPEPQFFQAFRSQAQNRSNPIARQSNVTQAKSPSQPSHKQSKVSESPSRMSPLDKKPFPEVAHIQTWGKPQPVAPSAPISAKIVLSQDALEAIAQIQRKALNEILRLQKERDQIKSQRDSLLTQRQNFARERQNWNVERQQMTYDLQRSGHVSVSNKPQSVIDYDRIVEENRLIKQENNALRDRMQVSKSRNIPSNVPNKAPSIQRMSYGVQVDKVFEQNRLLKQENVALHQRIQTIQHTPRAVRQSPIPVRNAPVQQQFDSQIAVYQNQLRRATAVINELKTKLANIPGLEALHEQGERIRQQTAELLMMKSGGGMGMVRQLQQRLEDQEMRKASFLEQLKVYKQRYADMQEENRTLRRVANSQGNYRVATRSVEPESSYSRNRQEGSYSIGRRGLGEYENALRDMQSVGY